MASCLLMGRAHAVTVLKALFFAQRACRQQRRVVHVGPRRRAVLRYLTLSKADTCGTRAVALRLSALASAATRALPSWAQEDMKKERQMKPAARIAAPAHRTLYVRRWPCTVVRPSCRGHAAPAACCIPCRVWGRRATHMHCSELLLPCPELKVRCSGGFLRAPCVKVLVGSILRGVGRLRRGSTF